MSRHLSLTTGAVAVLLAFGPALAQEAAPAAPDPVLRSDNILDASELEALSGGQTVNVAVNSRQVLTAVNSGNSIEADTVGSGAISLSDNALSEFTGVGNFVFNTGHNNNLQGSLTVNLVTAPAPTPGP